MATLLFIGDIYGRAGRRAVHELLPSIAEEFDVDVVIANGENARHGDGIDQATYEELSGYGIQWFTTGNHVWASKEFMPLLDQPSIRVLRPMNYPAGTPGRGVAELEVNGEVLTIVNLQGKTFMNTNLENPFHVVDTVLERARGFVFIDFHAEATSEKNTFGHYVDGRAGAVVGTHTHVQTADERILPKGTAYITDVGMTGPQNGSIGVAVEAVLPSFLRGMPPRTSEVATGPTQFNGVLIRYSGARATSIERVFRIID
jgi:metallophosphoesterase (TIGR00282 family)